MQKKFVRIVTTLLALAITLSLCACGKNGTSNSDTNTAGKVKIQVGLASNAKIIDFEDNALTKWLEDQCNIEIDIIEYSGGTDISTQISATIAARQQLPDFLWGVSMNQETVYKYGEEGYFANLRPYFEDAEGASKIFWDRIQVLTDYQQEYIIQAMTDPDSGNIYGVPSASTSLVDGLDAMAWINQKWLDKLNLTAPTNLDELYAVLKAFKENDCNGNGDKADEIPLFGSQNAGGPAQVLNWILNMHMYYNEHHLWQDYDGDGQLEAAYTQDAFREGVKFIHKLYEEKLLTSMVYTASYSDMDGIITPVNKVALCGIFLGHLTSHCNFGNETMYEYVPLKPWAAPPSVTSAHL